ncbi:hypothetical protein ASE00_17370 [Sphingomonas sp. Root710]|nr:hypothetical protein ASE00_17370 [Sphingomonas sp. Root710]
MLNLFQHPLFSTSAAPVARWILKQAQDDEAYGDGAVENHADGASGTLGTLSSGGFIPARRADVSRFIHKHMQWFTGCG